MHLASRQKRGVTSIETVVAMGLLVTAIGVTAPLIVRHTRLLGDVRNGRIATDALHNHLERLAGLPPGELSQAVDRINKAPFESEGSNAVLSARVDEVDAGRRVTLTLSWPEQQRQPSVSVVGWEFQSVEANQ